MSKDINLSESAGHKDCCCFKCCVFDEEHTSPDCGCEGGPAFYSIGEQQNTCRSCPKKSFCDVVENPNMYIIEEPR